MKKALLLCGFFIFLVFSTHAQSTDDPASTPQIKTIRWGTTTAPDKCCTNSLKDGVLQTYYFDENIGYLITLHPNLDKKYLIIDVAIMNLRETPFTVYPENFSLQMTDPVNKSYASLPPETVMKEINKRGQWRMAFAGAMAGMARQTSTGTVTDNRGNSADITISEPDRRAQANAANAAAAKRADNAEKAADVNAYALRSNTVYKDKIVQGAVFFKKDKLAPGLIISFKIENTIYEVPFGAERTKLEKPNL